MWGKVQGSWAFLSPWEDCWSGSQMGPVWASNDSLWAPLSG